MNSRAAPPSTYRMISTQNPFAAATTVAELEAIVASKVNINAIYPDTNMSALMHAVSVGNIDAINVLLEAGADVDLKNKKGRSAIFFAIRKSNLTAIYKLYLAGANVNIRDNENATPLCYAADYGQTACVLLLIELAADVNAGDKSGVTPLMMSLTHGHRDIADALLSAGADAGAEDKYGFGSSWYNTISPKPLSLYSQLTYNLPIRIVEPDHSAACTICQLQLEPVSCELVQCTHRYHPQCIATWIKYSHRCPTCRIAV